MITSDYQFCLYYTWKHFDGGMSELLMQKLVQNGVQPRLHDSTVKLMQPPQLQRPMVS